MRQLEIEEKRQQLINTVNKYGLSSTRALLCSQELDQLLQNVQQKKLKGNVNCLVNPPSCSNSFET